MKLLSGSSNPKLAQHIADLLKINNLSVEISKFPNGEKRVWIKDSVQGQNIILVQSLSSPVDENLVELLMMIDALDRMGARHINVVIPWMGYSLQDKVFRDGEPIAAKVVANLISDARVKRVFLFDLHNTSTPAFFSIPTEHITALPLFAEYVKQHFDVSECIVASPDFGGLKRARSFAELLKIPLVSVIKHRNLSTGAVSTAGVEGEVKGKIALIFDDVINTGSTVVAVNQTLKEAGAKAVHFLATHGLFANQGVETVLNSGIDSVVITDSIAHNDLNQKIQVVSCAGAFADALKTWM